MGRHVLSGWWRRVGAWLIDGFFVAAISVAFVFTVVDKLGSPTVEWWDAIGIAVVSALLYYPVLMRATNGRTLGKLATRIRVVRTDHKPMSFSRAAWREVVVKTMVLGGVPYAGVLSGSSTACGRCGIPSTALSTTCWPARGSSARTSAVSIRMTPHGAPTAGVGMRGRIATTFHHTARGGA